MPWAPSRIPAPHTACPLLTHTSSSQAAQLVNHAPVVNYTPAHNLPYRPCQKARSQSFPSIPLYGHTQVPPTRRYPSARTHVHTQTRVHSQLHGELLFPSEKGEAGPGCGRGGAWPAVEGGTGDGSLFTLGPSVVLVGEGACPDGVVEPSLGQRVAGWLGQTRVET